MIEWTKIKWPYNNEKPYCDWDCYQAKIMGYTVILYAGVSPEHGWSYTVRNQMSGLLEGVMTLDAAKIAIVKEMKKYF